jgi:hypothetical protein
MKVYAYRRYRENRRYLVPKSSAFHILGLKITKTARSWKSRVLQQIEQLQSQFCISQFWKTWACFTSCAHNIAQGTHVLVLNLVPRYKAYYSTEFIKISTFESTKFSIQFGARLTCLPQDICKRYLLSRIALWLLKIIGPRLVGQERTGNAQLLSYGSKHLGQNFFFILF